MWKLYDQLIEQIPDDIIVDWVHAGETWTMIKAGPYCGIAATINEQFHPVISGAEFVGKDLKTVASLCKSWNFQQASVGTAAINAFHNDHNSVFSLPGSSTTGNAFNDYKSAVANKKVAVIGHFHNLDTLLGQAAEIAIIERNPQPGDYPDSACEYLLPQADYVFMTGTTFINKTMPRLLQLCSNSQAIILGPSTPMSPILFEYGTNELNGLCPNPMTPDTALKIGPGDVKVSQYGQRAKLGCV